MGLFSSTPNKLRVTCQWPEREYIDKKTEYEFDIDLCGVLINSETNDYQLISAKSEKSSYNYGGIACSKDSCLGPTINVDVLSHKFESKGNKEIMDINLSKIDDKYDIIVVLASIYMGVTRNHKFGMIKNCVLDIMDVEKRKSIKMISLPSKAARASDFIPLFYYKTSKGWEMKWCNLTYWKNHTDDVVADLVREKTFSKLKK